MWATGLGPCARQALAAKGLAAYNRANLVPVHIDIARMDLLGHLLHPIIYARLQSKGQPIAGCVDIADHQVQILRPEPCDMQHRPKNLAPNR